MIGDVHLSADTLHAFQSLWQQYAFLPEAYNLQTESIPRGREKYPLRPELAESLYYLYSATKDPVYLQYGKELINSIESYSKTECGFATIENLNTFPFVLRDHMDSFFLSETCKYLYLLFTPDHFISSSQRYIFTTEAHPFPLRYEWLDNSPTEAEPSSASASEPTLFGHCLPSSFLSTFSFLSFQPRKHYNSKLNDWNKLTALNPSITGASEEQPETEMVPNQAPTHNESPEETPKHPKERATSYGLRKGKPSSGKEKVKKHTKQEFEINLQTETLQQLSGFQSISLSTGESGTIVEILTDRYDPDRLNQLFESRNLHWEEDTIFQGNLAQFGANNLPEDGLQLQIAYLHDNNGCSVIEEVLSNKIAIVNRGDCEFIQKVYNCQQAGASAVLIVNQNPKEEAALISMIGSGYDVTIPSMLISKQFADILREIEQTFSEVELLWYHALDGWDESNVKVIDLNLMNDPATHMDAIFKSLGVEIKSDFIEQLTQAILLLKNSKEDISSEELVQQFDLEMHSPGPVIGKQFQTCVDDEC